MKVMKPFISIMTICFALFVVEQDGKASDDSDPLQAQALQLIPDTADRICGTISTEGYSSLSEISGEASLELSKVIKSLVDIGIEGAAKYQESHYQGVLREDLIDAIKSGQQCKLIVFDRLQEKLIVRRARDGNEPNEKEKAKQCVLDPYNCEWTCNIVIRDESGQQLAAGDLVFGKVLKEPNMSFARIKFSSRRTRRLREEILFDSGAWSLGFFGKCLEGECMGFVDKTEPYLPVFLINKTFFDEEGGEIDISGVVMTKEHGKHTRLGLLSGVCRPR